jgi:hypothetical protein
MEDATNLPSGGSDDARPFSVSDADEQIAGLLSDPDEDNAEEEEASTDEPEGEDEGDGEAETDDEAEGDGDDEGDPDAEDVDQSDDPIKSDARKVKLDDGTVTTVGELKKGFLRQADYTRKTQEVAAKSREVQARAQTYAQHEQNLSQWLPFLQQELVAQEPKLPDPEQDPIGHMKARTAREQWQQKVQTYQAEMAYLEQMQAQRMQEQAQAFLAENAAKLAEVIPEYRDPSKLKAIAEDIRTYGTGELEFSPDEIASIADYRYLRVLNLAVKYLKSKKAVPAAKEKVAGKPQVQKPSRRQPPQAAKARERAEQLKSLRSTGSARIADRLIEKLL